MVQELAKQITRNHRVSSFPSLTYLPKEYFIP